MARHRHKNKRKAVAMETENRFCFDHVWRDRTSYSKMFLFTNTIAILFICIIYKWMNKKTWIHMNEKHLESFSSKKKHQRRCWSPNLKVCFKEQHLEGEEMESFRCRVKRQFSSWEWEVRMKGIVCRDASMFIMCCERGTGGFWRAWGSVDWYHGEGNAKWM